MSSEEGPAEKIVFKPKRRKNLRARRTSEDEDEGGMDEKL